MLLKGFIIILLPALFHIVYILMGIGEPRIEYIEEANIVWPIPISFSINGIWVEGEEY